MARVGDGKQSLLKELNKEIDAQNGIMKTEIPSLQTVLSSNKAFLKESGFEVVDEGEGSVMVQLKKPVGEGQWMAVRFDVSQVIQRSSSDGLDGEAESEDADYSNDGSMENIELEVEIGKEGDGKKLLLACELDLGYDVNEDGDGESAEDEVVPGRASLYITDARMVNSSGTSSAYEGPDYSSLDEGLQEALTEYVQSKLGDLHALGSFIDGYSGSKEGAQYARWLSDARNLIA